MGPDQSTNNPPQSPPPTNEQPPVLNTPEPSTTGQPVQPISKPPQPAEKKSRKKLIIIVAVVVVIIAAIAAYAVYAMGKSANNDNGVSEKDQTVKDVQTDNAAVNAAKDLLNEISSAESTLADTDQTNLENDISNSVKFKRPNGREHEVAEIGLRHPGIKGTRSIHIFDVTDGSADFRLEFDAERLTWHLTREADHA